MKIKTGQAIKMAAEHVAISPSTLIRRLAAEEATYQSLLDDEKTRWPV
jgi:hypothetical protein